MKQFKQKDIVVSTQTQKTNCYYAEIDINYISQNICTDLDWIYFEETLPGKGSYPSKNFRHATLEEIKAYEEKGPHVLSEMKTEEEDLTGRWIKALVDNPECTSYKKGEYAQILKKYDDDTYEVRLDDRLQFGASPSKKNIWELMPEGFSPVKEESTSETFVVGDWIVFNNTGGSLISLNNPIIGQAYQILSLNQPFKSEGDCNASLTGGKKVRLSSVSSYEKPGHYEAYFRRATPKEVLKVNKSIPEEMEQYVELIRDSSWGVKKGAICKIIRENECASNQWVLENIYIPNTQRYGINGDQFFCVKSSCIPSTKEAYEAQIVKDEKTMENVESCEYVELLANVFGFKVGDIAKVIKPHDTSSIMVFVPNRISDSCLAPNVVYQNSATKPSTKEAYDRQHFNTSESIVKAEYKIGDYVVCIGDENKSTCGSKAAGWEKNLCFVVKNITAHFSSLKILWEGKNTCGVYEDQVRMATQEEANECKIHGGLYTVKTKESQMDKWLKETKAKNMSLEDLTAYIEGGYTCPFKEIYSLLEGNGRDQKAEILYNKWYPEKIISTGKSDYVIGIDPYEQKEEKEILPIKHQAPVIMVKKKNTSKLIIINK